MPMIKLQHLIMHRLIILSNQSIGQMEVEYTEVRKWMPIVILERTLKLQKIFMNNLDNHTLALETDHTEFLLLIQITAMVKNSIKNHGMNQSMEDPKKVESGTMMELTTIQ